MFLAHLYDAPVDVDQIQGGIERIKRAHPHPPEHVVFPPGTKDGLGQGSGSGVGEATSTAYAGSWSAMS